MELLIKPGGSGRSDMSGPDEDSAERSTGNNSKRNLDHACITGARVLAVHAKELLKAMLIDLSHQCKRCRISDIRVKKTCKYWRYRLTVRLDLERDNLI